MRPTASSLERAEACPVSYSLPSVTNASEWAERGTAIHEFIRVRLANRPMDEALKSVPEEHRETCRGIDMHELVGDLAIVRSEVSYAIDVRARTVRELGVNIHRNYEKAAIALGKPLGPHEIPGTLDIEGRTRTGVEMAGDVKTGYRTVLPIVDHRQAQWEVLARYLAVDAPAVDGRIFKIDEAGAVRIDRHLFGGLELDTIGDELEEIHEGVIEARDAYQRDGTIRVSVGPWCSHCDSLMVCPAQTDLARAVTRDSGNIVAALTKLTREEEWIAIEQWKAGEKVLEAIGNIMKERATQRLMMNDPITSPDGSKYFGLVASKRSDFSKPLALALLHSLGATEEQIKSLWVPHPIESWRILNVKKAPKLTAKRSKALDAEKARRARRAKQEPPCSKRTIPSAAMRERANES